MKPITLRYFALALLAGTAVPAIAQATAEAAPAADAGLEEIVVTAERRAENIQDVPISVSALTADALESQGIRTVNDLAATVPNLTTTTGPQGSADANFFIRGVGQFDFIATNDPGVGVYVDGVYLGRTVGALIDSGDIERVEVLRGPQGTLFGRNTLGGAVSITSKAPSLDGLEGTARATYGSRDRIDVDGSINAPLSESAALRLYAFTRNQDGFARRDDGVRFGKTERYGGRAQLLLEPTETISVNLSADYSNDQSNPAPSVLLAFAPFPFFPAGLGAQIQDPNRFYRVFASNSPESSNEIYGFSGTVSLDVGDATVRSITAYRNLDALSTSDPDGTGFRLYDQRSPTKQNQFSQELQLTGTAFGDRLDYLVGGYYFRERVEQTLFLCFAAITPVPTAPGNACNTWNQGNDQRTESYALFGQARLALTDALSVTLGGRYTIEDKTNVSNQAFDFRPAGASPFAVLGFGLPIPIGARLLFPIFPNPFLFPNSTGRGEVDFEKFTPKVGFEYKPNDDVLIFGSYAKGFRSGGFNGRLIAPQPSIPTYEPDTNDAFELGFKSDLGRTVRFNAAAFYSKYKGIQQTISDPSVQFRVANAGEARLYGFEAELTAVPTDALRVSAAIGYTNSEFQDVPPSVCPRDNFGAVVPGGRCPIDGNSLPFAPEWTLNVGAEYAVPVGDYRVTPRIDYRYQARTFFTAFNLPLEQQEGYGLLSARVTLTDPDERFSVSLFADNLTDEEYYTFGQNALGAQGVAYNYLGRPREYGVTASLRF